VDAVVHMAALLHIINPPPAMREKYELVNVGGTAAVVEAAIKAGVKRVVLFSRTDCLECERRRRSTFSLLLTWFTNMLTWQT